MADRLTQRQSAIDERRERLESEDELGIASEPTPSRLQWWDISPSTSSNERPRYTFHPGPYDVFEYEPTIPPKISREEIASHEVWRLQQENEPVEISVKEAKTRGEIKPGASSSELGSYVKSFHPGYAESVKLRNDMSDAVIAALRNARRTRKKSTSVTINIRGRELVVMIRDITNPTDGGLREVGELKRMRRDLSRDIDSVFEKSKIKDHTYTNFRLKVLSRERYDQWRLSKMG